jgi:hypothetical protein
MRSSPGPKALFVLPAVLLAVATLVAPPASGQTTTAQVRGTVTDAQGAIPAMPVIAVNAATGARFSAATAMNGAYVLVLPAGSYELSVSTGAHAPWKRNVQVGVGQSLQLDVALQPASVTAEVSVVATAAEAQVERVTSEIATNVNEIQIQSLPQSSRNFLNFAALAPGVRLSRDELRQEYSYGAQGSSNTNVFIDGTSYKNDVLLGGSVGQDASRGNPFPQNAVQEFRVITQNFKAEYQKASSAIITAVTKSGGNELHGDVFVYYQNKNLVAIDGVTQRRADANNTDAVKPEYERWQPGVSLGGPIVKDRIHFFASYEGNVQDREYEVFRGTNMNWPAAVRDQFAKYEGLYTSPFRSTLLFGKVTASLAENSTLDVSSDLRHETDIRGFGGQTSYQAAENVKNDVWTVRGKHTAVLGSFLNEATASFQRFKWNPVPQDNSLPGLNYDGLMRIGSKDTQQNFTQDRLALRDDVTLMNLQWNGDHVVKGGVTYDYLKYHVIKQLNGNPVFNFRNSTFVSTPGDMPYNAIYGVGDPDLSTNNTQFGLYVQDDWRITSRFTANVGLRWDFETDMLNNDYETPADVRAAFAGIYPSNYLTDGTQRDTFYGAVQPRVGLSWDVRGDGKTILHGGYGKYYDRTLYNDILDEKFRLQYKVTTFWFSPDGGPMDGRPAIKWDPKYLSLTGLQQLLASGEAPQPELFFLANDTRPPSSDQWSLGIRHDFGLFNAAVSYTGVKSKDQLTWTCGIKNPDGTCNWGARPAPGYGFSMLSRSKEAWFDSVQVVLDKPFSASAGWGAYLSYVWSNAEQTGNDLFSWGKLDPVNGIRQRSAGSQEHQITFSGIVALPWEMRASTLVTLGSGYPFGGTDCSAGWDKCVDHVGAGDPPKWTQSIDVRLEKRFTFAGSMNVGVFAEAINVFNYTNEKGYDGWQPALPEINANYGKPNEGYNPRRIQLGASFGF